MASEGAELDLYADDIGDEFAQENDYTEADLYDDVITSNSKSRAGGGSGIGNSNVKLEPIDDAPAYNGSSNQSQTSNHSNNSNLLSHVHHSNSNNDGGMRGDNKKPCIYVGNLTWWTTDDDVTKVLSNVGINDVVEIKFFENRANGQSKGFCVVTLQMDSSVRTAIEKLPKVELYGQTIAVTMCNRQNLNNFEMKSRKPGQNDRNGQNNNSNNGNNNQNFNQNNQNRRDGTGNFVQNQGMSSGGGSGRPPLLPGRPGTGGGLGRPNNGPLLNNQPRLPQLTPQALPFGAQTPQWSQLLQNGPHNAGLRNAGGPTLNPMMRMPQVGLAGVGQHPLNAPQINALFGSQSLVAPSAPGDHQFGNRFGGMNPYGGGHPGNDGFGRPGIDMGLQLGDAEFEEILNKNKNLANSALQRAMADATAGNLSLMFPIF